LKLLKEIPKGLQLSYVLFVTGDGPHESRVCQGLTSQFNGNEINLLNFRSPLPPQRVTGLPSLIAVRTYIAEFSARYFIWTCDKEYFVDSTDWTEQVNAELMNRGANATVSSRWGDAARFDVKLGPKEAILWCALTGTSAGGRLEENLSQLIYMEFQEKVAPDKEEIRSALNRRRLKIETLISQAKKPNLRQAAPSLFSVFEDVENQLSSHNVTSP